MPCFEQILLFSRCYKKKIIQNVHLVISEKDTHIGFVHWSLLCSVLVANSRERHLRAQEKEPAVDVREGFALAWPFVMTCRETNNL